MMVPVCIKRCVPVSTPIMQFSIDLQGVGTISTKYGKGRNQSNSASDVEGKVMSRVPGITFNACASNMERLRRSFTCDDCVAITKLAAEGHGQRQLGWRFGVYRTSIGRVLQ